MISITRENPVSAAKAPSFLMYRSRIKQKILEIMSIDLKELIYLPRRSMAIEKYKE
jgi:hypothetical protein